MSKAKKRAMGVERKRAQKERLIELHGAAGVVREQDRTRRQWERNWKASRAAKTH